MWLLAPPGLPVTLSPASYSFSHFFASPISWDIHNASRCCGISKVSRGGQNRTVTTWIQTMDATTTPHPVGWLGSRSISVSVHEMNYSLKERGHIFQRPRLGGSGIRSRRISRILPYTQLHDNIQIFPSYDRPRVFCKEHILSRHISPILKCFRNSRYPPIYCVVARYNTFQILEQWHS